MKRIPFILFLFVLIPVAIVAIIAGFMFQGVYFVAKKLDPRLADMEEARQYGV